jgi:hypothetical protein
MDIKYFLKKLTIPLVEFDIERMIRQDVPIHLNSKEIIFTWIVNNW